MVASLLCRHKRRADVRGMRFEEVNRDAFIQIQNVSAIAERKIYSRPMHIAKRKIRVVVVGGGVMGASVAWHLTRSGAAVTLIEHSPNSETSATATSFGWVGASASTPSDDPKVFAERLIALEEVARMRRDLGTLPIATCGAILWGDSEDETSAMIVEHRAAGTRMQTLSRAQIIEKEPRLAAPPSLAAWAPDDFALEAAAFAKLLILAAQANGACIRSGDVEAIKTRGDRIEGVVVEGQGFSADVVVLANGYGARGLASTVGVDLSISQSPAVLMRFDAEAGLIRHLLCVKEMELRPASRGGLFSPADYPAEGEVGLAGLAESTSSAIADLLNLTQTPQLLSVGVAQRPMTIDGAPLCGEVGQIEGLYGLVAHPGVILAPRLGRLCSEAILGVGPSHRFGG